MTLVSVIIPARNAESTISHTLGSLLNQTIRDIEVIVIDDCSEDGTIDKVSAFKDSRLRILKNQSPVGPGSCRNLGIQAAVGEYLGFVDADDAVHPEYVERLVGLLGRLGPKAVVASDVWICRHGRDGCMMPSYTMFRSRGLRVSNGVVLRVHLAELVNRRIDIKPLINTRALARSEVRFWDATMGEEWLPFLVELTIAGFELYVVGDPLYYYRVHGANISRRYETVARELGSVDRLLMATGIDQRTLEALYHYRQFLRARVPWVALRSGRLGWFVKGLLNYPPAIVFPAYKVRSWLRREWLAIRS